MLLTDDSSQALNREQEFLDGNASLRIFLLGQKIVQKCPICGLLIPLNLGIDSSIERDIEVELYIYPLFPLFAEPSLQDELREIRGDLGSATFYSYSVLEQCQVLERELRLIYEWDTENIDDIQEAIWGW